MRMKNLSFNFYPGEVDREPKGTYENLPINYFSSEKEPFLFCLCSYYNNISKIIGKNLEYSLPMENGFYGIGVVLSLMMIMDLKSKSLLA